MSHDITDIKSILREFHTCNGGAPCLKCDEDLVFCKECNEEVLVDNDRRTCEHGAESLILK